MKTASTKKSKAAVKKSVKASEPAKGLDSKKVEEETCVLTEPEIRGEQCCCEPVCCC